MQANSEAELQELSKAECLALLASVTTGHLAVTRHAMPVIVPVRIHLRDDQIAVESLLGEAVPLTAGSVVALEAGTMGQGTPQQWTIQVCGFLVASSQISDVASPVGLASSSFRLSADVATGWLFPTDENERRRYGAVPPTRPNLARSPNGNREIDR